MNLNHPEQLETLAYRVNDIAQQAAAAILDVYSTEFEIERKDDKSPVTDADLAAHRIICRGLEDFEIEYPVLSEESASIDFATRRQWSTYWLVDPLDGTREFIKRNGEFTVNIALIHNHRPIIGVVNIPVTGISYLGIDGVGSYKINGDEISKIQTSTTNPDNITIAGSRSHGNPRQQTFIENFPTAEILAVGSSLKFCLVAEGKADIYPRFGPTSEWDTAAAQCVVEQAGGLVVTHHMQALTYNQKESLLNPEFLAIGDTDFNWQNYL